MSARRRDRWYSLEGQRRIHRSALETSKGPRHLISLMVLLALVLIGMQQVSDPKRVDRVAKAVGLLHPDQSASQRIEGDTQVRQPDADSLSAVKLFGEKEWISWTLQTPDPKLETQAQILSRLLKAAPASLLSHLVYEHLIAPDSKNPGIPTKESTPTNNEARQREFAQWLATSKDQVIRWTELSDSMSAEHAILSDLSKFLERMPEGDGAATHLESEETRGAFQAFRLALDRSVLLQFADNTPWRSGDRIPLMRTTQRAVAIGDAIARAELAPEILPAIAVPQLTGDTDSLRGKGVRISGRIVLVDQNASMTVEDPRIREYAVLWLRPDDGSNQPIIVHVPTSLGISPEAMKKDRSILVSGLVAKRRAYASNRGGEIAPVIVASHLQAVPSEERMETARLSEEQKKIAKLWHQPRPIPPWLPPVDIGGALARIQQRIGSRSEMLHARIEGLAGNDLDAIDTVVRDELVQSTLDGLHRVIDDVQLIAKSNRPRWETEGAQIRSFQGIVTEVRRVAIEKEPFPGWQWKELFVCLLEPMPDDRDGNACAVITQHVPSQWLLAESLRQPAIATGPAFHAIGDRPGIVMISPVIQWRDATLDASAESTLSANNLATSPTLPAGWNALLQRGWNLDWIDSMEGLQGKSMTARESQAFYSLLRCSQPPLDTRPFKAEEVLSIMQTIQRAESRKNKRDTPQSDTASSGYRVKGVAEVRRVQRVDVSNADEQAWLGADHYYQLDGFADIGNTRITIRFEEMDEPIVFEKEFPVTLVALNVPDSLLVDAGDAVPGEAQAWYPRSRTAVSGWFYRMWRFKTTQVSEATNDREAQQGPLLVIDRFDPAPAREIPGASNVSPPWVTGATTAIGIAGGLWILYQIRRGLQKRTPKR
jgi:hypothetical protein